MPSILDFLSNRDKESPRMRGEDWLLYSGISVFETREQAEALRDRIQRHQGRDVYEVPLPPGFGFMIARTRRTPGHHTLWGRPRDLLMVTLDRAGVSCR